MLTERGKRANIQNEKSWMKNTMRERRIAGGDGVDPTLVELPLRLDWRGNCEQICGPIRDGGVKTDT
jgi:hypothetical protein